MKWQFILYNHPIKKRIHTVHFIMIILQSSTVPWCLVELQVKLKGFCFCLYSRVGPKPWVIIINHQSPLLMETRENYVVFFFKRETILIVARPFDSSSLTVVCCNTLEWTPEGDINTHPTERDPKWVMSWFQLPRRGQRRNERQPWYPWFSIRAVSVCLISGLTDGSVTCFCPFLSMLFCHLHDRKIIISKIEIGCAFVLSPN